MDLTPVRFCNQTKTVEVAVATKCISKIFSCFIFISTCCNKQTIIHHNLSSLRVNGLNRHTQDQFQRATIAQTAESHIVEPKPQSKNLTHWVHLFSFVLCAFQMCPEMACLRGCILALVAFVWLFTTVCFQMVPQNVCT